MHNMYAVSYNELVFDLLEKRFGKHEAVVFARSSATGGQRFPVVVLFITGTSEGQVAEILFHHSIGEETVNQHLKLWLKPCAAH